MSEQEKKVLVVWQRSPLQDEHSAEVLESVLLASSLEEMEWNFAFRADGLQLLRRHSKPQDSSLWHIERLLSATATYGIQSCYIESDSASERGLHAEQLMTFAPPVHTHWLSRLELSLVLREHDVVLSF